eukprot:6185077-Pleurochrysis_carterae.AAC.3
MYLVHPDTRHAVHSMRLPLSSPLAFAYAASCTGSGRDLLRQLARESIAMSTATNATVSSMIHALEVRGIAGPKMAHINSFLYSIER